jgi:hypothetical protein
MKSIKFQTQIHLKMKSLNKKSLIPLRNLEFKFIETILSNILKLTAKMWLTHFILKNIILKSMILSNLFLLIPYNVINMQLNIR